MRLEIAHATANSKPQYHLCHITCPQEKAPLPFDALGFGPAAAAFLTAPLASVCDVGVGATSAGVETPDGGLGVDGPDMGVDMSKLADDEAADEASSFLAMFGRSRATGPQY